MMFLRLPRLLIALAVGLILNANAIAADLTVFAAASLKESLDEQVKVFSTANKTL